VIAGSLGADEPVASALAAAALLPEVEVRVTGAVGGLPASIRSSVPPNVVFTGFLPYARFLGELLAADAVAVFTTEVRAMNRAAFEVIGLGRPLVLSEVPGLRRRFEGAALFCANEPEAMAHAIRWAVQNHRVMEDGSRALRRRLQGQREAALEQLRSMLELPDPSSPQTAAQAGSHP
jgi:glycosyltransferase involved in cell wall biosynthesis